MIKLRDDVTHRQSPLKTNKMYRKADIIEHGTRRMIRIRFSYDVMLLHQIRELPGRTFDKENKWWLVALNPTNVRKLEDLGFEVSDALKKTVLNYKNQSLELQEKPIPGLKKTLFPFQATGVAYIESREGRVLLADQMGLGKTVQALAWIQLHPELRRILIVVPSSLKLNWLRETRQWVTDNDAEVMSGTIPRKPQRRIVIINYDILNDWLKELMEWDPELIVTDECHYYKSAKAIRTKAIKKLARGRKYFIAISGTPIENRPIEIYNAINIINPQIFPNYWNFVHQYCKAKHNGFGWDVSGASNTEQLHKILTDSVMIRRKKADVLTELPQKMYSIIPLELSNEDEYRQAENDLIDYLLKEKGDDAAEKAEKAEALIKVGVLRRLSAEGKLEAAIKWVKEFLEVEDKLVIFAVHKTIVNGLMRAFASRAVKIDGSSTDIQRQQAVDRFQEDPKVKLFIGNIRAAGVGLTLTASNNVAILELPWTPTQLEQAEDRCHRYGQKKNVTVYNLIGVDTIDERIIKLLNAKRKIVDSTLDGTPMMFNESVLNELLNELKIKRYEKM